MNICQVPLEISRVSVRLVVWGEGGDLMFAHSGGLLLA